MNLLDGRFEDELVSGIRGYHSSRAVSRVKRYIRFCNWILRGVVWSDDAELEFRGSMINSLHTTLFVTILLGFRSRAVGDIQGQGQNQMKETRRRNIVLAQPPSRGTGLVTSSPD